MFEHRRLKSFRKKKHIGKLAFGDIVRETSKEQGRDLLSWPLISKGIFTSM